MDTDPLWDLVQEIADKQEEIRSECLIDGPYTVSLPGAAAIPELEWVRVRLIRLLEAADVAEGLHPFVAWPRYPGCRVDGCGLRPEDPIHDVPLEVGG